MWAPSQRYTLTAQPIALQLHCWVSGSEKRPIGLQFGMWPKTEQVTCHYCSTGTTGKPSVTLQEFFRNHAILMCTNKRRSHHLIKNTKRTVTVSYQLFSAQYKTLWLRRTPHRPSQFLIFKCTRNKQGTSLPKVTYGLDMSCLCKGLKKENISSSSSKCWL